MVLGWVGISIFRFRSQSVCILIPYGSICIFAFQILLNVVFIQISVFHDFFFFFFLSF